jgi:uncharacterized membrane protein YsdA (DUF1294 family)
MTVFLTYFPYIAILLSNVYGFFMAKNKTSKEAPLLIHSFFWGSIGILIPSLLFNSKKSIGFWIGLVLIITLQSIVCYYLFIDGYWNYLIEE